MQKGDYIQPESCENDHYYYLLVKRNPGKTKYQQVRFLSYRPHPAEALVHDGRRPRVVHRRFLFCKASGNGRDS